MSWLDIVGCVLFVSTLLLNMYVFYMKGKLDGVRECRRIVEAIRKVKEEEGDDAGY